VSRVRLRRARQAGLTLVEIMVSVVLVGIACAFALGAQVRMSGVLHDQTITAQTQQTLRVATDSITRDLQMAGFLASSVFRAGDATALSPLSVVNGGTGPDQITILYADSSTLAVIPQAGNDSGTYKTSTGTLVASSAGFAAHTLVLATHIASNGPANAPSVLGIGCLLEISGVDATHIVTDPVVGGVWTVSGNSQCDTLAAVWNDGYTAFAKPVFRSYRIKPNDSRGVLQMSPSGTVVANDWQDVALGIIDLQIALRVYQKGDATDEDGDGNPEYDWFSGDNMNALPSGATITAVSITVLAKSTADVTALVLDKTPDLMESGKPAANNRIGDVAGTTLPQTSTSSPYYGAHIFRTYTQTVNLRNSTAVR
jgi:prepilin-type N-terminal cleavage/methylation domain-containing protein